MGCLIFTNGSCKSSESFTFDWRDEGNLKGNVAIKIDRAKALNRDHLGVFMRNRNVQFG